MWLSRYVCLFAIYSCMGWIYETAYCTLKEKKWQNRGFLYGPACPIYGVGAVAICVVMNLTGRYCSGYEFRAWQIFLISVFGSMILEYVTSWTLERFFHAVWWDYSNYPFNLHGRISLFTSLGFGAAGLLVIYVIAPCTESVVDRAASIWLEFFSLLFVMIFAADLTLTASVLIHFERIIIQAENSFNGNMDSFVDNAYKNAGTVKDKFIFEQNEISEKIRSLGQTGQTALQRVLQFRYPGKYREILNSAMERARRKAADHASDTKRHFFGPDV